MNNRIGVIILTVVCVGLGIWLIVTKKQASTRQSEDTVRIDALSNKWTDTSKELVQEKQVTAMWEKDMEKQKQVFAELTNEFSRVSAELAHTSSNLTLTASSLKASQAALQQDEARIADLESQNQKLDKQAIDLSSAITNLTIQIEVTQKKLAASEGDRAFLEKELRRLQAEKAELERQFNDLVVLRAQVARLKEELSIARRIEWIRQGLFASTDQKGAQKLMQGISPPQSKAPKPNYDLNVEVNSDGSIKVIPPPSHPATNPPPPPPPK